MIDTQRPVPETFLRRNDRYATSRPGDIAENKNKMMLYHLQLFDTQRPVPETLLRSKKYVYDRYATSRPGDIAENKTTRAFITRAVKM